MRATHTHRAQHVYIVWKQQWYVWRFCVNGSHRQFSSKKIEFERQPVYGFNNAFVPKQRTHSYKCLFHRFKTLRSASFTLYVRRQRHSVTHMRKPKQHVLCLRKCFHTCRFFHKRFFGTLDNSVWTSARQLPRLNNIHKQDEAPTILFMNAWLSTLSTNRVRNLPCIGHRE